MDGCFFCFYGTTHTRHENHFAQFWPDGYKPHGLASGKHEPSARHRPTKIRSMYQQLTSDGFPHVAAVRRLRAVFHCRADQVESALSR